MSHAYINADALQWSLSHHNLLARAVAETGSTNDDLKAAARENALTSPTVLVAQRQTAGRGTRGRSWTTPHKALLFSLALPNLAETFDWAHLPLASGMACVAAARRFNLDLRLKWPNDLWFAGGKTGGILCERVHNTAIVGIGINLSQPPVYKTTQGWAVSAVDCDGRLDVQAFLTAILEELMTPPNAARILADWPAADAFFGQAVSIKTPAGRLTRGRSCGINLSGAYVLQCSDGRARSFTDGALSGLEDDFYDHTID